MCFLFSLLFGMDYVPYFWTSQSSWLNNDDASTNITKSRGKGEELVILAS